MRQKHERLFEIKKAPVQKDEAGRVKCPYCPATFSQVGNLSSHRRLEHREHLVLGLIKCDHCPATFQTEASLHRHTLRRHADPSKKIRLKCFVCDEIFRYPKMLINHLQTHPNVEYKCCFDWCAERFARDDLLHRHIVNHMLIQCDNCHKTYTHYHKCEVPAAEKKFICDSCGKGFVTRYQLKIHMNSHTDNRPYKCDVCGKSFRRPASLWAHAPIHSEVKRLKCNVIHCHRAFVQHTDLYRHQFKAHGIFRKKFPCTICDQVFPENALLRKHLQNHEAV